MNYMYRRLVDANIKKDGAIVEEVLGFAKELRDTWEQAMKIAKQQIQERLKWLNRRILMNGTPEGYIQRLVEISKKKMDCLKSILSLTRAQTEAISEEGMDGLQSLIDQKQSKIDEINGLDEEFNACFTALKQKLGVKAWMKQGHWA